RAPHHVLERKELHERLVNAAQVALKRSAALLVQTLELAIVRNAPRGLEQRVDVRRRKPLRGRRRLVDQLAGLRRQRCDRLRVTLEPCQVFERRDERVPTLAFDLRDLHAVSIAHLAPNLGPDTLPWMATASDDDRRIDERLGGGLAASITVYDLKKRQLID